MSSQLKDFEVKETVPMEENGVNDEPLTKGMTASCSFVFAFMPVHQHVKNGEPVCHKTRFVFRNNHMECRLRPQIWVMRVSRVPYSQPLFCRQSRGQGLGRMERGSRLHGRGRQQCRPR